MPQLLLELLSEEIPARMQARAAQDLLRLVSEGLKAGGLEIGKGQAFATPRRLTVVIDDVPEMSPAISDERKGPRVGAPEKALQGFLRGAGLQSIDEAEVVSDPKKGDFYVARIDKPGRPATEIIAEVIPEVAGKFPWPKSMRWGDGDFQWVRPLQSILCLLDSDVVPFEIAGLKSGNETTGHRFHGRETIAVESFEDYGRKLLDAKVLLPASERAAAIAEEARQLADDAGLELVEDEALMLENAGLTEWPTALMGTFDEEFLEVPAECLITSMKSHQKCFSLRDPKTGNLTNRFILVSNLIATDGGKQIVEGNEKVIRARLADAKFFWDQDLKRSLNEMLPELRNITFHYELGTQLDKSIRMSELAFVLAGAADAVAEEARTAAFLCKADLVSEMVGEFPELQGLMGRYYAEKVSTKPEIARAIELHYKPKGPSDTVPLEENGDSIAIAVALADKVDTLVGFWTIDEKPTGSGDPYQLRRAALGVIRILIENDLRVNLTKILSFAYELYWRSRQNQTCFMYMVKNKNGGTSFSPNFDPQLDRQPEVIAFFSGEPMQNFRPDMVSKNKRVAKQHQVTDDLLAFFADRLKVHLRDEGKRHDLIDAVFALPGQDDIALIVKRVEALSDFLETDDGANLLAGVKRATNILAIEEKKDKRTYDGEPSGPLMTEPAERALAAAIAKVKFDTQAAINVESFAGAMSALAELRAPVDKFFDDVTVNADDKALRENRLRLLAEIRAATLTVADFSRIAG